ncbi:MAG: hypothetical protein AAB354_16280 [candidate division KSB1 bacterium]
MNLVLAHGFLGFRQKFGKDYFNGVEKFLAQTFGAKTLAAQVDPDGGIAERSAQLQRQILLALGKLPPASEAERRGHNTLDPQQKTHIIAHSMGGLDSRMLLSLNRENIASHIASLTTISTPHRGSPIADLLVAGLDEGFGWALLQRLLAWRIESVLEKLGVSLEGLRDLTSASCAAFNEKYRDHPQVKYFSVAGMGRNRGRATAKLLQLAHKYIRGKTGESNDGLVSLSSAQWGEFDEALWAADHADEIGHDLDHLFRAPSFDHLAAYRKIVERVRAF